MPVLPHFNFPRFVWEACEELPEIRGKTAGESRAFPRYRILHNKTLRCAGQRRVAPIPTCDDLVSFVDSVRFHFHPLRSAFGGRIAPVTRTGRADGLHAEPVLRSGREACGQATSTCAHVDLRPRSARRWRALRHPGLRTTVAVPTQSTGSFLAQCRAEVRRGRQHADGCARRSDAEPAAFDRGGIAHAGAFHVSRERAAHRIQRVGLLLEFPLRHQQRRPCRRHVVGLLFHQIDLGGERRKRYGGIRERCVSGHGRDYISIERDLRAYPKVNEVEDYF